MKKAIIIALISGLIIVMVACAPPTAPAPPASPQVIPKPPQTVVINGQDDPFARLVAAAQRENELNLYSFELVGDAGLVVSRAFKEKYGINVNIITGRGAEFVERIRTEQRLGQVVADLVQATPAHVRNLKALGLTASLTSVPSIQEKNVWSVDPFILDNDGHLIAHRYQTLPPLINTQLVKPSEEPKSYKDLLHERWKGKIADGDPKITSGAYTVFITLMNHGAVDVEFLRGLGKQDLKFFSGTADVIRAVAKGEYPVALVGSLVNAKAFLDEGAPMKALSMQEGTVVQVSTMAGIKNAPHPNAAQLFVNWVMSQEGQTIYTKPLGIFPVRKDVEAFIPAAVKTTGKLIAQDPKDMEDETKLFRDQFLVDLWKK
ncbi:MAG: extracellular solute-binding protein [Dehalococcoidia bacterium]|nr:extracellular solute-binding protein [Dehalococcoidia bacterium]